MTRNQNHPKKGSSIRVSPIRETSDIEKIKNMLSDNERDYAIFIIGINTALRASDLLELKYEDVANLNPGETFFVTEKKTGKLRQIMINKLFYSALHRLLTVSDIRSGYIFRSRKCKNDKLKVTTLHKLVKGWCRQVGLSGNYGSHTLRKTWGYHQRVTFGVSTAVISACLGHSSERVTRVYLCISSDEINGVYLNEVGS